MNIIYYLVTRDCHNQLKARGWPDGLNVMTDFEYSRGNGVAFYGELCADALRTLIPVLEQRGRLMAEAVSALKARLDAKAFSITLMRKPLSGSNSHPGTIQVVYCECPHDTSESCFIQLYNALREDIREICSIVAKNAYVIEQAVNPTSKRLILDRLTRNFRVSIMETEPEYGWESHWDVEYQDQCLDLILNSGAELRTLHLSVSYKDSGYLLGEAWESEVIRMKGQPRWRWFNRGMLREAVTEARGLISDMQAAFSTIRKVDTDE